MIESLQTFAAYNNCIQGSLGKLQGQGVTHFGGFVWSNRVNIIIFLKSLLEICLDLFIIRLYSQRCKFSEDTLKCSLSWKVPPCPECG